MKTFLISVFLFAYSAAHAVYIAKIQNFSLQPAAIWYEKEDTRAHADGSHTALLDKLLIRPGARLEGINLPTRPEKELTFVTFAVCRTTARSIFDVIDAGIKLPYKNYEHILITPEGGVKVIQ